jgi:hypothetical protein
MDANAFAAAIGALVLAYGDPENDAALADAVAQLEELQGLVLELLADRCLHCAIEAANASADRLGDHRELLLAEAEQVRAAARAEPAELRDLAGRVH